MTKDQQIKDLEMDLNRMNCMHFQCLNRVEKLVCSLFGKYDYRRRDILKALWEVEDD